MIRRTVERTKESTFIVQTIEKHPYYPDKPEIINPAGTGFFITSDGFFITANHVIEKIRNHDNIKLSRPNWSYNPTPPTILDSVSVKRRWPDLDIALLKVDFEKNKSKEFLKGLIGFPFLEIDYQEQVEGTPIYSCGFPLPDVNTIKYDEVMTQFQLISPRITSGIISSNNAFIPPMRTPKDPKFYAIDRAFNQGNSGGPVILSESGKVFSVCTNYQSMQIDLHIEDANPKNRIEPSESDQESKLIEIPSLYGISSSLSNIKDRWP